MIILLDTSTPTCYLTLVKGENRHEYEWLAQRNLARDLLAFLRDRLAENQADFQSISAIGVMKGPGSFTGLRIGLTVMNTIASDQKIPIVGVEDGQDWRTRALTRLEAGENDQLVMPEYGGVPNITKQKK